MKRLALLIACSLGFSGFQPASAVYNCYDYCNPAAVAWIKIFYVLRGYQITQSDALLGGVVKEASYVNSNLGMSGALANGLGGQSAQQKDDILRARLDSYAEIRKRLSMAKMERHMRQSFPAAKAAQSINAKGEIVTADGVSKVGKEMAEVCKIPSADGYGQGGRSGNADSGKGDTAANGQANNGNEGNGDQNAQAGNLEPIDFAGSPEQSAKALFEVFNRLKLMTTGVQAIAYVNPMTSRNLGAQPNQIYTIYTQRPMGDVTKENTGWPKDFGDNETNLLRVEVGANASAFSNSVQNKQNQTPAGASNSSSEENKPTINGQEIALGASPAPKTNQDANGDVNENENPFAPLSVFQLWAQSPLIEPENMEQIFNRHSVDIEMFEMYKNFRETQSEFNNLNSISPITQQTDTSITEDQTGDPVPNDGVDRTKPPFKAAANNFNYESSQKYLHNLSNATCTWTTRNWERYNAEHKDPETGEVKRLKEIIFDAANEGGLPMALASGLFLQESQYNTRARSNIYNKQGVIVDHAYGLAQFIDTTRAGNKKAPWYHPDPFNPFQNARAGVKYLRHSIVEQQNNDILFGIGGYNAGPNYKGAKRLNYFTFPETRKYIPLVLCYTKLMLVHNNDPPKARYTETFDFATDLHLITALGFNAEGLRFYLPLSGRYHFSTEDEYGMEKYGIFVENSNAYRNVERTDMSNLFAWLSIQYNNNLNKEILNNVFAHLNTPPTPGVPGDDSIEANPDTVKTEKQEKMGIGAETVKKDDASKQKPIERGTGIHDSLVNNYAQYLSAYWFDPIVVPPTVYPDTEHMTTAQLNLFYAFVRKRLEMSGTPTRIGNDRVPLQVLKALVEGGNDAYAVAFAHYAATGNRRMPDIDRYTSPYARNWIAEATIAEVNRGLVNSVLVDHLEFRLRPDRSSWPSYNAMALHMGKNPDDLGKVISPTLALDMALYSAYNPVKHLISPEDALELKSFYSHGYYPFMRYYGDMTTPVGEEPNRFTEQVVLDKTINYLHDPKFMEFMEMAHGDDLLRQRPRYTGLETYIAYRRLKESRNKQRLLIAWASTAIGTGIATESSYHDGRPGFDSRVNQSGTAAFSQGRDNIK